MVIVGREIGVTLLRFWVLRHGVIPASRGGKAKTLVQAVAIGLYVLPLPELLGAATAVACGAGALLAVALVLTVVTGAGLRAARAAPARQPRARVAPTRTAAAERLACSPWADVTTGSVPTTAERRESVR